MWIKDESHFHLTTSEMIHNAQATHTRATTAPAYQLTRSRALGSLACARASAITSWGIIRRRIHMPSGTRIRSSSTPSTGMKSGIRSRGESAYPITSIAHNFATSGVRGSALARDSATRSRLRRLTAVFSHVHALETGLPVCRTGSCGCVAGLAVGRSRSSSDGIEEYSASDDRCDYFAVDKLPAACGRSEYAEGRLSSSRAVRTLAHWLDTRTFVRYTSKLVEVGARQQSELDVARPPCAVVARGIVSLLPSANEEKRVWTVSFDAR
jgi:hypothetical protein